MTLTVLINAALKSSCIVGICACMKYLKTLKGQPFFVQRNPLRAPRPGAVSVKHNPRKGLTISAAMYKLKKYIQQQRKEMPGPHKTVLLFQAEPISIMPLQ
jgi:hypothetical protein